MPPRPTSPTTLYGSAIRVPSGAGLIAGTGPGSGSGVALASGVFHVAETAGSDRFENASLSPFSHESIGDDSAEPPDSRMKSSFIPEAPGAPGTRAPRRRRGPAGGSRSPRSAPP